MVMKVNEEREKGRERLRESREMESKSRLGDSIELYVVFVFMNIDKYNGVKFASTLLLVPSLLASFGFEITMIHTYQFTPSIFLFLFPPSSQ